MTQARSQSKSIVIKSVLYFISLAIVIYVLVYMPTPYMINKPGTAEEIKPMVAISEGDAEEKGAFMLTTVSVSYANLAMLFTSRFNEHAEVVHKEPDRNEEEYATQQRYYMNTSQSSAVLAAYNRAGIAYSVVPEYVFVIGLSKTIATKGDFKSGDKIVRVNGHKIDRFEDLSASMQGKAPGSFVSVEIDRGGTVIDQEVELVEIGKEGELIKAGLGVSVGEVRKVEPKQAEQEVKFEDTRIGGPSAGLMFTLEIYNQLTPGDLSRGYRIAGTGTINEDGEVGAIGGVQFKVVASDRKQAEIFFVPEDNYKDAKAKAEKMGTDMKIVPVKTLDDALAYLSTLPIKE